MEIIKKYIGTDINLSSIQKYSYIIGFILLLFVIYCQYKWNCTQCYDVHERFQNRIKNNRSENFHTIIANLLDSQQLSDKIVLEVQLDDMETLLKYNDDYKSLNREPILSSYQERLVSDFIKYRDFYHIDKTQTDIVTLVRSHIDESPLDNLDNNQKILALNLLRRNIYYFYPHYFKKQEVKDKIKWMQKNLGLKKINDFVNGLKKIFGGKHWFGIKNIENTIELPDKITVYHPEENAYYHKISSSKWLKYKLKTKSATVNNSTDMTTIRTMDETIPIDSYRKIYKHMHLWYGTDILQNYSVEMDEISKSTTADISSEFYEEFEIINSVSIPNGGYMFFDYPTDETYDNLTKILIQISAKDSNVLGDDIDVRNIGFWLRNLDLEEDVKKYFVKTLITSYYYANFETFMDLLAIMSFFDVKGTGDIIDLFPDKDILYFNNYWTYKDWDLIQQNSLKMGQCSITGEFEISKIGSNWRFTYSGTNYYNYWSAVEAYINDLVNSITFGLKTNDVEIVASVAEFCYINNTSFIDYLHEGSKCEEDTCNDVDISRLFEPDRCQHLKDKYRQLHLKISNKKCADLTNFGESRPVIKDVMMFNIMRLALKVRECQIDFELTETECVDNELEWDIDTNEQANDKDLSEVKSDDKGVNASSSPYDKQLQRYRRLMAQQEKQQLAGLNALANQQPKQKNIDDMTLQEFGHYIGRGVLNTVDNIASPGEQQAHQYTQPLNNIGLLNPSDPTMTTTPVITNINTPKDNFTNYNSNFSDLKEGFTDTHIQEGFTGDRLWETKPDVRLKKVHENRGKKVSIINEETRNKTNKEQFIKDMKKQREDMETVDQQEFERVNNIINGNNTDNGNNTTGMNIGGLSADDMKGVTGKIQMMAYYLKNMIIAITQEDRMMFTGFLFIFLAISLYFIDITSD